MVSTAVDMNDFIVPAERTFELQKLCKNSRMIRHNEGESRHDCSRGVTLAFCLFEAVANHMLLS